MNGPQIPPLSPRYSSSKCWTEQESLPCLPVKKPFLKGVPGQEVGSAESKEPESGNSSPQKSSPGQRARFHLPRRRAPRGGGTWLLQPISGAGAGSCRYKGLGAAAARPRSRSAQRGQEGGREGGRGERTEHPEPDWRAEGQRRKAERRDLCWKAQTPRAPRGCAGDLLSPAPAPSFHPLPPADHSGLGYPRARPRARARLRPRGSRRLHRHLCSGRA